MSNIKKVFEVINKWNDTQSSPSTWATVISCMEGPIVNNKRKADEIRQYLSNKSNYYLILIYKQMIL